MNKVMTVEEAQTIAQRCAKALEIAGTVYVQFPFNQIDLAQAAITLGKALNQAARDVPKEEHTLLARQHTALKARYAKMAKKFGVEIKENDSDTE
jgi:hypothetical protein